MSSTERYDELLSKLLALLPPEKLAALPDEYLRSLSSETQEAIRRRLNRS